LRVMRETRFNIGDVVEDKAGSRGIIYTTERIEVQKQANSVFSEICVSEYSRDDVFGVEWFQGKQTSFLPEDELLLCSGMTYASLCYKCDYRFSCWTARRK
jgi:uncharacterized protein YodC (DUF2158 family)